MEKNESEKKGIVVIYGGSFDPPHEGHVALAAAAIRQLRPEFFYFVPNFHAPFKEMRPASFDDRAEMIRIAFGKRFMHRPGVEINSYENDMRETVYTWKTVGHFRKIHPDKDLFFLMGSDCLRSFKRWQRWRYILKNARLLVGIRPGFNIGPNEAPFVPLDGIFPEAASTEVRLNIILDEKINGVSPGVVRNIKKKGLYFSRESQMLEKALSPERHAHCVNVARIAAEIAGSRGMSKHRAAAAGLLHDCAREFSVEKLKSMKLTGPILGKYRGETVLNAPKLLHAPAGAKTAREKYGVRDPEILEAIQLHPTGAPGMGELAKLIYVADYISAERKFDGVGALRKLALENFPAAFKKVVEAKAAYRSGRNYWSHPLSLELCRQISEAE